MASSSGPEAGVVGAGIVGLSAAWFLQREGFQVTVFDSRDVAAVLAQLIATGREQAALRPFDPLR
jgi:glycine/D-amino acid oxidase-like deaminating enzyme